MLPHYLPQREKSTFKKIKLVYLVIFIHLAWHAVHMEWVGQMLKLHTTTMILEQFTHQAKHEKKFKIQFQIASYLLPSRPKHGIKLR